MMRSFVAVLLALSVAPALACSGTGTTEDGGAASRDEPAPDGSASSSPSQTSKVAQLCAGLCGDKTKCANDERSVCYAALSTDAKLAALEACGAQGKCGVDACGIATSTATQYVTACRNKVGACGGSIDGVSAGDCDDIAPVFRDDVIAAMKACLSQPCGDVSACWKDALASAEPAACGAP